jgi:hypothetical protein
MAASTVTKLVRPHPPRRAGARGLWRNLTCMMCLPGTDGGESSSGRKGPRFPFPTVARIAPGRILFPKAASQAHADHGLRVLGQARAPAQRRQGSLSPTAARDGRDWHLVFPCHRSRPAIVIPSHADARADRGPDKVDDRVTGLSGARSGSRGVIPGDASRRCRPVRIRDQSLVPRRRRGPHHRGTCRKAPFRHENS